MKAPISQTSNGSGLQAKAPRASFAQLRSFEAVARLGGVTKAAAALHLTQPTVSTQLRELSQSLGVDLLRPAGRGVQLTDEGRSLLATVTQMFESWSGFEESVAQAQGLLRGALRIAGVTTTEYFLAQWLKPFMAQYPGISVELVIDNRDNIVRRLEQGQDDMAVMMMPPTHLALHRRVIMDNPLVLIAALDHPWAQGQGAKPQALSLKSLSGVELLMREPGSGTRQATLEFLAKRQLSPRLRMTLGSNEAIKHAVAAGLGLAVVSQHTLALQPAQEGLCVIPMRGLPIARRWHLVWREDRRLPRIAAVFMDFAAQHAAQAALQS